jgi:hypothetical protein
MCTLDSSGSGLGPVVGSCEHGHEPSGCIKDDKSFGRLGDLAPPSFRCTSDPSGSRDVSRTRSVAKPCPYWREGTLAVGLPEISLRADRTSTQQSTDSNSAWGGGGYVLCVLYVKRRRIFYVRFRYTLIIQQTKKKK